MIGQFLNSAWEVFIGIVGQDPSDSKSRWCYMLDVFQVSFIEFEVYSIDSSKLNDR
jgi:hypothetical protein